jgi:hypothetical protein
VRRRQVETLWRGNLELLVEKMYNEMAAEQVWRTKGRVGDPTVN